MRNLASLVTKQSVEAALDYIDREKPKLRSATIYQLQRGQTRYPPKEVVRWAAKLQGIENRQDYRLQGGPSTNRHLQNLGFVVEPFRAVTPRAQNAANERRMARICWNDNGWVFPSGRLGKSKDKKSHEGKYGYGHEEWLMDTSKLINGYNYGFLEPI